MLIRQKGGWRLHHQAYLWPRRQRTSPHTPLSSPLLSPRRRRGRVNDVAQSESDSSSSAPSPRKNGSCSSGTDNDDTSPLLSVSSSSSSDRRDSCGTDDSSSLSSTPSLSELLCFSQRKSNSNAEPEDDIAQRPSFLKSAIPRNSERSRRYTSSPEAVLGEHAKHISGLRRRRNGNAGSRNAGHQVRAAEMDISNMSRGDHQEFENSRNACCCIRYNFDVSSKTTRQTTRNGEDKGHEFCITNFSCLSSHKCSNNSANNVTDTTCNNNNNINNNNNNNNNNSNNNNNISKYGSFHEDNDSPPGIVCNSSEVPCFLNAKNGVVCLGKCPISERYAGLSNPEISPYYTVLPSLSYGNNNSSLNNNNIACSRHLCTPSMAGKMMLEATADASSDAKRAIPHHSQILPSAGPVKTFVASKKAPCLDISSAVSLNGFKCETGRKTACDNCRPCHSSASARLLSELITLPTSQSAMSSTTSCPSTRRRNNTGNSLNYIIATGHSEVPQVGTVGSKAELHIPNTIEKRHLPTLKPWSSTKESWLFHRPQQLVQISKSSHLSINSSSSDNSSSDSSSSNSSSSDRSSNNIKDDRTDSLYSTSVPQLTSTSSNPSTGTQYDRSPFDNSLQKLTSQQTSPHIAALSFLKSDSTLSSSFSSSSSSSLANESPLPTQSTTVRCKWRGCSCDLDASDLLDHIRKHAELQVEKKTYACYWLECKVFNKPSWSCSWLERHIITHSGHRPFKCILDSCGQRFHSQAALERHVNGHFTATSQLGVKSNRAREVLSHRMLQKRKMHLKRRFAHIVKMNDLFDERTMSVVKHELQSLMEYTNLDLVDFALHITFRGLVVGRRFTKSGNTQSLVEFKPNGVLDSKWIPEAESHQLSEITTALPRLPTDTVSNLHNSLYRRHRFRKHRRK